MKKIFSLCLVASLSLMPQAASAQSLGSIFKSIFGGSSTSSTTSSTDSGSASTSTAAQDILSGVLGSLGGTSANTSTSDDGQSASSDGIISGILNSVLNSFGTVSQETLVGSWNYKGSAFVFESDNVLASLGSDAIANQVAAKVDTYLAKVGVKQGSCSISFAEDNSCVFTVGERSLKGTYTFDTSTKELALAFGLVKTTAYVVSDSGTINIVFQSNGLLKILKAVCAASSNSTLKMLNTLLANYNGLRVGMAFTK